MPDAPQIEHEHVWRLIILALFRAQEAYLRAMKTRDSTDAISQAWERLQQASRRRDEFLGTASERNREPQSRQQQALVV